MHKTSFKKSLLVAALSLTMANMATAANVPADANLAKKQELVWNVSANPATLDPQKMEGDVEGYFARQLFEMLVTSDEKGHILPGAATSWQHSDDFKTWTFFLRPNAKWSNGDAVTAHDFVYAWQRLADPNTASPYASYLDFLKLENADKVLEGKAKVDELGVEAKDDHTLVLHLTESVPYVDKLVEHYVLSPVHKSVVEKFGDAWTKPGNLVGNGAFKLNSMVVNEKAVLVRNPHYWDNDKTVLEKVTLLPIESAATDVARYRAGDEDVTGKELPIELFAKLKKEVPNEIYTPPVLCTYTYEMNTVKPPFNDARVRKALSLALDRHIMTDKILQQGQTPAYLFTPPFINGAEKMKNPEWANWDQSKRNQEAIKLLKEAGYDKSNPLNFKLLYNTSDNHKKLAIAAQSIWKKNLQGVVDITLDNQEWKTYLDTRRQGNSQMARAGWCADYNEATTFLNYFLSNSANNRAFYKNKAYDDLIDAAFRAKTDEERAEIYAKAEQVLEQDSAVINVYYYVQPRLLKPWVKGFAANHPAKNYYLKDVYILKH